MEYILTDREMKEADNYAIEKMGIPSVVLMERAAMSVVDMIRRQQAKKLLIVCGTGNNGADGLAICRMLVFQGFICEYTVVGNREKATEEWKTQKKILDNCGINEVTPVAYTGYDVVVDALFGVGLKRDIKGEFKTAVERINESGAKVIAVDIPSGVNGENGEICGVAVKADITVTFGYMKVGLVCCPGKIYAGRIEVADIGYPPNLCDVLKYQKRCVTCKDLLRIPKRDVAGNKGIFGKIVIIAGSEQYCGAAVLAAKAAYRMGAGMVKVITHEKNRDVLCSQIPEVLMLCYGENLDDDWIYAFENSIAWADSVLIGPGLSVSEQGKILLKMTFLKIDKKPLVLDADALNLMAKESSLADCLSSNMIVTPHHKEMERLSEISMEKLKKEPQAVAENFSKKYGCCTVLKDAVTITTDGREVFYNLSGNSGMATAGSGDVLAGMLATACTWNYSMVEVAALTVYVHGLAGDMAAQMNGEAAVIASDLVDAIKYLDRKLRGQESGNRTL